MFKTIEKSATAEIVERKSKFIANLYYIESVEEAEELVKQTNKKYFDARHNCYAFSVVTENGMVNRFSDDGEPSGTAGRSHVKYSHIPEFVECVGDCHTLFWWDFARYGWTC